MSAQRKQFEANHQIPEHGKLDAAEQTVRSAIELAANTGDGNGYVQCLDALADIFSSQGNFAAVEKVTQDALQVEATLPHPEPMRMARRVPGWASRATRRGASMTSFILTFEKAVALHEESFGPDHPETGNQMLALGVVHRAQGNHTEAEHYLRRALKIHERTCGMQSKEAIEDLHHLAGALEDSGNLEAAAAQYERALSFKHRSIGGDLNELAQLQFGMAGLYIKWQNYSRAQANCCSRSGEQFPAQGRRAARGGLCRRWRSS